MQNSGHVVALSRAPVQPSASIKARARNLKLQAQRPELIPGPHFKNPQGKDELSLALALCGGKGYETSAARDRPWQEAYIP